MERFRDRRYRRVYMDDFVNTSIAAQIQALRKARRLSQRDLAAKIGTKQGGVSRLEDVNYSGWKVSTLKRLARAFDVALVVRFESFGSVLDDIAGFRKEALLVPSFDKDPVFATAPDKAAWTVQPGVIVGRTPRMIIEPISAVSRDRASIGTELRPPWVPPIKAPTSPTTTVY
jgi:transcriptional regulator with XRE-family HTH domain